MNQIPTLNKIIILGYSGHALVVAETLNQAGFEIVGYLDKQPVKNNLLHLPYFGFEKDEEALKKINGFAAFAAIGDNQKRRVAMEFLRAKGFEFASAISPDAHVSSLATFNIGTLVCRGACINPFAKIGQGVIINTGAIVEHECIVEDYAHIAPGGILAGNVIVGKGAFIGANAIVKQGVKIGNFATIGAGAVVLKDVPDNSIMVGNPAFEIKA